MPSRQRPFRAPSPLKWYMRPGRVFHLPSSGNTREAPATQKPRSQKPLGIESNPKGKVHGSIIQGRTATINPDNQSEPRARATTKP